MLLRNAVVRGRKSSFFSPHSMSIKHPSSTTSSDSCFINKITPFILMYGTAISAYSLGLIVVNYYPFQKKMDKTHCNSDTIDSNNQEKYIKSL